MKVHIVYPTPLEDSILGRLARALAAGNGWTLGAQPDPRADLNYWAIYIDYAQRASDWHMTPTAAYFSHYEAGTPFKEFFWHEAAEKIDLALFTDPRYADGWKGACAVVIPPVDAQFKPMRGLRDRTKFRVGVAGWVPTKYGARKGTGLVAKLAAELAERQNTEIVGAGYGWPVPTREYDWNELPAWYNGLDVFVCTSMIEGIPMPPLEALACGVPVVIPTGVGLLDTLRGPGVYHYEAGSYEGLRIMLEEASAHVLDANDVRANVAQFTSAAWYSSHKEAFDKLIAKKHGQQPHESDRHGNRGVLYVAYGEPARKCAAGAIASFHQYMPSVPAALVSAEPLGPEDIFIPHPDADIGGRSAKTLIDTLAPREWGYVMYLDADTEVVAPIDFLFRVLEDGYDMVICKNPGKYHTARQMERSDNHDECDVTFNLLGTDELIQFNGGVFAYARNVRTAAFFEAWHKEWTRWGKRDQGALLRALAAHPLKLYVLGNEWNTITRYDPPERTAGILHYPMTARRWRGVLHARSDSPEAWAKVTL